MTTTRPVRQTSSQAQTKDNILLVDDNPNSLDLLAAILVEKGYQVQRATSGAKALAMSRKAAPVLILLDIKMPEMDGYEVCQHLKTDTATRDIPIIFLSAMDGTLDKVRAFSVGGSDYIPRPFQIEEVVARIENQLSQQRLQQEIQQANEALEQRITTRTNELSQAIVQLKAEIVERKRAEEALQHYTARLGVLHQIDRAILAAHSSETIAQVAVEHIPALIPCQWASMIMFDVEVEGAILLAVHAEGTFDLVAGQHLPLSAIHNLVDLQQGQPIVEDISVLSQRTYLDEQLVAGGMRSRIQAPLMPRDKLLGCLCLAVNQPDSITVEHSAIAEEVASQLALALENLRLQEETRRRSKGLSALNKASRAMASTLELNTVLKQTMAEVKALLEAEGASVLLHDPEHEELVFTTVIAPDAEVLTGMRLPLDKGIAGWVMQEQEPVLVDDVQHDARFYDRIDTVTGITTQSLLAVPMTYKDKVIGVIEVVNKTGAKFRQHDLEMLEALSSSAAIAIENAQLYEDLQDRMKALQEAQQQLIQSEKMAALGRLLASITHEINNPLQSVQTCLTLTKEEMGGDQRPEKIDRYLGIVESEIERVSTIVRRMRDFYRPGTHQGLQSINVHLVLDSVLALVGKQLQNSEIKVEREWLPDLPEVEANADHLKQVFLNLVLNAVDAMPDGGTLHIRTGRSKIQPGKGYPPRPAIRLSFRDTGQGMSPETLSHLFEPFFTTKPNGSGLGLGISYGIIEAHHGQIMANSYPKKGTIFTILLPIEQPPEM